MPDVELNPSKGLSKDVDLVLSAVPWVMSLLPGGNDVCEVKQDEVSVVFYS